MIYYVSSGMSTSVYMEQLYPIWQKCVFLSLPALVVISSVLHQMEILRCLGRELYKDNIVLLSQNFRLK